LINLFFPDGNYLDMQYILYHYEVSNSKKAVQNNKLKEALEHLAKAKYHAAEMDKIEYDFPGEYQYTAPLFDMLTFDSREWLHTNDGPALRQLEQTLNEKEFHALRNASEFQDLINSLK